VDLTLFGALQNMMGQFVGTGGTAGVQESLDPPGADGIRQRIDQFAARLATTPRALKAEERRALIGELRESGSMEVRRAMEIIALHLGVSRATVYNDARLLLLDKDVVESLLLPDAVIEAVHEAFVLHSHREGRVFPVVREPLATGGTFGIKAGEVSTQNLLGFKAAGFWPSNRKLGGEPHQATIMLFDPATGRPTCIIDGNAVTTMRTAAAGALGLQQLARPDSASACLFGTGVQARAQLSFALRVMPMLKRVRYVSASGQRDERFEARFSTQCEIALASDRNAAVAVSDVVITTTPGAGALFDLAAVQPGTHLNCVGADTKGKRELPEGLLARSQLFVDDRAQASQIGETQWAPNTPCIEFGDVLSKRAHFNREPQHITVFDMTGLALQDLTVARMLFDHASQAGLGSTLGWPW
jgi:ornithine cyclodeaminase